MRKLKLILLAIMCVLAVATAFAFTRTAVTPVTVKGPYPGTVNAGDLAFTFTAADIVNLNSFAAAGNEVLIVQNTDAASQTITLTTKPDGYGRSADIATYSIPAGGFAAFNFHNANNGWIQADNNIYFQASAVTVKFAVLRIN